MKDRKIFTVTEIFGPTVQGEGYHAGTPSIFIRFTGCNAWDGRAETKASSLCPFCDTNFLDGTRTTLSDIVDKVQEVRGDSGVSNIVLTGGEPLLQVSPSLVFALRHLGYSLEVETNGTVPLDESLLGYLWVTCSPKVPFESLKLTWAYVDALKMLYPHPNPQIRPTQKWEKLSQYRYLQPIEDQNCQEQSAKNLQLTLNALYLLKNWKLSLQTHKYIGVP